MNTPVSERFPEALGREPLPAVHARMLYAELGVIAHIAKFQLQGMETWGEPAAVTIASLDLAPSEDASTRVGKRRRKAAALPAGSPAAGDDPATACFAELAWLSSLVRTEPGKAWEHLRLDFESDATALERACRAAGPLEDLLVIHGPAFIDTVIEQGLGDEGFAAVLSAVWRSGMDPGVWRRLQSFLEDRP